DERWRAFESAVVSAGLTENAPLMIYGNDLPMVEQRIAVVYELWDLLSHHRRGRFDGFDGLDLLAKQTDATAALVQALTPSETPPAAPQPFALAAGGFTLRGKLHTLTARPYQMLRALLEAHHHRLTANQLREAMDIDDLAVDQPEQVVKDTASKLRKVLRKAAGMSQEEDPLPSNGRGEFLTYALKIDSHPNLSE